MKTIKIIVCLGLLVITTSASGQVNLPKALEIPINKALQKNANKSEKQLEVEKTRQQKKSAISNYIPTIEATGGYAYFNNDLVIDVPTITLPSGTELFEDKTKFSNKGNLLHGGIMARTVLFSGMQVEMGAKALEQKAQADELLHTTEEDSIVIEVINSFDLLHYIKISQLLIDDSDKRLEKEELRVTKAIENGLAIPFDRDKIQLARLTLEEKKTELEGSEDLIYQKIKYFTGMERDEIQKVLYELDPITTLQDVTVEDKQELSALEHYQQATKYLLRKEQMSFLPQIVGFAGVNYSGIRGLNANTNPNYLNGILPQMNMRVDEVALSPNWMVGVGLKWELFSMDKIHRIKQAKIAMDQIQYKYDDVKEKLNLLLNKKKVDNEVQLKKILIAKQQQKISENSRISAEEQYKNGLISITDRLEAENDFIKMQQQSVKSIVDQRKSALEVVKVTGNLAQKIQYK